MVHEAGGALTRFDGAPLVYNSAEARHGALVAAGRARHAARWSRSRANGAPATHR